jgi:hypothetical protein
LLKMKRLQTASLRPYYRMELFLRRAKALPLRGR